MKATARLIAGTAVGAALLAPQVGSTPASADTGSAARAVSSCNGPAQGRWYSAATSGTGKWVGTGSHTWAWKHWSLHGRRNAFSAESIWVYHSGSSALEAGFGTGKSAAGGFSNSMIPYFTLNDGLKEYDAWSRPISPGKHIWISAVSNNKNSWVSVAGYNFSQKALRSYRVGYPHTGSAQGEVNFHDIWMGGGSGETLKMYWESKVSGKWTTWGWNNGCRDKPYWYKRVSKYQWSNGGYGTRY
jgi:hypothetical protein